jgi:hypothetical protein
MILVVKFANIQRALGRKNKLENFSARKFSFGEKKNSGALLLPIWVKVVFSQGNILSNSQGCKQQ